MADFFIRGFGMIINVLVIIMVLGVIAASGFAAFGGGQVIQGMDGPLAGLVILIGGLLYVVFVAGLMYLGLGIYHNTKRTADMLANR